MFGLVPWKKSGNGSAALANRSEHPLELFRNEFDTLFDRFFSGQPEPNGSGWGMETDETDSALTVKMDAPGFEPGDFDVRVSGDTLRVTAGRQDEKGNGWFQRRFQRSVTLPAAVDADQVQAKYTNGVLELSLPKAEQAGWKKIAVQGG
ncbi:Heat shock protein OS=planctomycete KSU-1 GN=KSU1_D0143 PE=3 SV=1: HSP20 [Gemmata massiliana]|uniref:SHSP domain-containing protein n=1 Tax=Gemmata massiliana TaxID=1210884 RepID=A0A6P2CXA1_9BACT|nr:Hsp20/alpha crystallin family protein [Gemmata massiliana]VTR92775.1 Heat shock protein OS=planctomycete KSU-1 GN=KSU1_D0143 PE=3 SV=1: HSP20 [Gemmata massiliana]